MDEIKFEPDVEELIESIIDINFILNEIENG